MDNLVSLMEELAMDLGAREVTTDKPGPNHNISSTSHFKIWRGEVPGRFKRMKNYSTPRAVSVVETRAEEL